MSGRDDGRVFISFSGADGVEAERHARLVKLIASLGDAEVIVLLDGLDEVRALARDPRADVTGRLRDLLAEAGIDLSRARDCLPRTREEAYSLLAVLLALMSYIHSLRADDQPADPAVRVTVVHERVPSSPGFGELPRLTQHPRR